MGTPSEQPQAQNKLFDFENPPSFKVGLNKFTAPAGAFAYQNVNHFIVLSGFDSPLKVMETTSDAEDGGGETGAVLHDSARERALGSTGQWVGLTDPGDDPDDTSDDTVIVAAPTSRGSVLRVEVEGSRRDSGILASNYAQPSEGDKKSSRKATRLVYPSISGQRIATSSAVFLGSRTPQDSRAASKEQERASPPCSTR